MELSVFPAKILGLYLVIVAPAALLNRRHFPRLIKDFSDSLPMVVFRASWRWCWPPKFDAELLPATTRGIITKGLIPIKIVEIALSGRDRRA